MARVEVFQTGSYMLVFNRNTLLGFYDSPDSAMDASEQHACGTVRGQYDVYKLGEPVITGKNGVAVDWAAPSKRPQLKEGD